MCLSDDLEVVEWSAILEAIRPEINPATFRTWLEVTGPARIVGNAVVVDVPNPAFAAYINQTWGFEIRGQLKKRGYAGMTLRFKPKGAGRAR